MGILSFILSAALASGSASDNPFPVGYFESKTVPAGSLEIYQAKAAPSHLEVNIELAFPSSHTCGFSGQAVAAADNPAVLIAASPEGKGDPVCKVELKFQKGQIMFGSAPGFHEACQSYCGFRAGLYGNFAVSSRLPGSDSLTPEILRRKITETRDDPARIAEVSRFFELKQVAQWDEHVALASEHLRLTHPVALRLWKAGQKKRAVGLLQAAGRPLAWNGKKTLLPALAEPLNDLGFFLSETDGSMAEHYLEMALELSPDRLSAWLNLADERWKRLDLEKSGIVHEYVFFKAMDAHQQYALRMKEKPLSWRITERCPSCKQAAISPATPAAPPPQGEWELESAGCLDSGKPEIERGDLDRLRDALKRKTSLRKIRISGTKLTATFQSVKAGEAFAERVYALRAGPAAAEGSSWVAIRESSESSGRYSFHEPPWLPIEDFTLSAASGPLVLTLGRTVSQLYCRKGLAGFKYSPPQRR